MVSYIRMQFILNCYWIFIFCLFSLFIQSKHYYTIICHTRYYLSWYLYHFYLAEYV